MYAELTRRVHGPVLTPGAPGFDDELAGFQTGEPHRPDIVVGAEDAADVAAAVTFAAEHGLPVAVHATGHGRAAGIDGGVVISTHRMAGVRVYPDTGVAHIGAGARWAQVAEAAAEHGLAPLSGSFPAVGAVGYLLGGGLGLLGRRYGWAADHVRAIDLVTADGVARRATADTEPELFWALRGGREPLAVVTAVEVALFAVPQVVGGGLFFAATDAPQVLPAVRAIGAEAPDELGVSLGAIDIPDLPAVPAPLRGRQVLHVRLVDATPEGKAATDAAERPRRGGRRAAGRHPRDALPGERLDLRRARGPARLSRHERAGHRARRRDAGGGRRGRGHRRRAVRRRRPPPRRGARPRPRGARRGVVPRCRVDRARAVVHRRAPCRGGRRAARGRAAAARPGAARSQRRLPLRARARRAG